MLTHWGLDKMDAISQTTFSNAFFWMKMHELRLRFHWSLFLSRVGVNSIPELELQVNSNSRNWNWNWWNLKWHWNWKPWNWNWNWKPELNFLQWLPQHLLVNQPFPNFSLNRGGHDLSCDWLLMQQVCSWDIAPLWCGHKRHMGRVPRSPWVDRGQKD